MTHPVTALAGAARRLAAIDPSRAGVGGLRLQLELALFPDTRRRRAPVQAVGSVVPSRRRDRARARALQRERRARAPVATVARADGQGRRHAGRGHGGHGHCGQGRCERSPPADRPTTEAATTEPAAATDGAKAAPKPRPASDRDAGRRRRSTAGQSSRAVAAPGADRRPRGPARPLARDRRPHQRPPADEAPDRRVPARQRRGQRRHPRLPGGQGLPAGPPGEAPTDPRGERLCRPRPNGGRPLRRDQHRPRAGPPDRRRGGLDPRRGPKDLRRGGRDPAEVG